MRFDPASVVDAAIERAPFWMRPWLRRTLWILSWLIVLDSFASLMLGRTIVREAALWLVQWPPDGVQAALQAAGHLIYTLVVWWRAVAHEPIAWMFGRLGLVVPGWAIDLTVLLTFLFGSLLRVRRAVIPGRKLTENYNAISQICDLLPPNSTNTIPEFHSQFDVIWRAPYAITSSIVRVSPRYYQQYLEDRLRALVDLAIALGDQIQGRFHNLKNSEHARMTSENFWRCYLVETALPAPPIPEGRLRPSFAQEITTFKAAYVRFERVLRDIAAFRSSLRAAHDKMALTTRRALFVSVALSLAAGGVTLLDLALMVLGR